MSNKEKLLEMNDRLEKYIKKESELKGQYKEILNSLKEEHNVDNIKQAKKLLAKLKKKNEELDEELDNIIERLEEDYEWD